MCLKFITTNYNCKLIFFRGIMDHLYGNNQILKLKLGCVPNNIICLANSTMELLYGGVGGAELQKTGTEQS